MKNYTLKIRTYLKRFWSKNRVYIDYEIYKSNDIDYLFKILENKNKELLDKNFIEYELIENEK